MQLNLLMEKNRPSLWKAAYIQKDEYSELRYLGYESQGLIYSVCLQELNKFGWAISRLFHFISNLYSPLTEVVILKKLLTEQTTEQESAPYHMFLVYLNKNTHFELNPKSVQVSGKFLTNLNKLWDKFYVILHVEPVLCIRPTVETLEKIFSYIQLVCADQEFSTAADQLPGKWSFVHSATCFVDLKILFECKVPVALGTGR